MIILKKIWKYIMSLFDISKDDPMRSIPAPNTNDSVTNRLAHGTTQNQNSGEIAEDDGLKFLERQIIAKQDGFNKAAFGFYGDANKFGLKVAQDGFDVLTASDSQLIFNSEQNSFKILSYGGGSIPVSNPMTPSQVITATGFHNLGFTPAFIAFGNIPTGGGYIGAGQLTNLPAHVYGTVGASFGQIAAFMQMRVDDTALYIDVINPSAINVPNLGSPWRFTYYLLQETAATA